MKQIDVDVLIAGAGPTGLSAALLLGRMGISCHLIERRPTPQRAPAAHVVNARTLEVWRQAGADMTAISEAAQDPADAGFVHWVDKLGGQVIGRLPFERQGQDVLAVTPTPLRNISQHRVEPILVDSLAAASLPSPCYSHQWQSARQSRHDVISRVRTLHSGEDYEVRSRFLLAADGAGSPIRRWLGIAPLGPDRIQSFLMVHFRADLGRLIDGCRGVLFWTCDPRAGGIFVCHDAREGEWVYMHPWDPDNDSIDRYDAAACETLVRRALVEDADVAIKIATVANWTMTAQVAQRYRQGRVFLVGDSAHRFPPTGGLGLNTGVQDAHNLAWKLAHVLRGLADDCLLDTYETERRPVAQNNADQSLANAMRLLEIPQALGTIGEPEAGAAAMRAALADPVARAAVDTAIANQAEHFDMLGLQLGFRYGSGALVADGHRERESTVRELVVSSAPGSRLPHGWIERDGRRISMLDLIALDAPTLLVGPDGEAWIEAAAALAAGLHCVRVGRDNSDGSDVSWWTQTASMPAGGALLVRPDQHVAFRAVASTGNVVDELRSALDAVLPPPAQCAAETEAVA